MFAFFILIISSFCKIPPHLKEIYNKALENSRIKSPKEMREDTKYPGDYSFPNISFTLKVKLDCPISNQIKGYAIDNSTIAIVKRKAFNLNDKFVFVDPPTQNVYEMDELIASDDKVNIYRNKQLSFFDIFTNFHMRTKTIDFIKDININWDTFYNSPQTSPVENMYAMELGIGAYGSLGAEVELDFKNKNDCLLRAFVQIDFKVGMQLKFQGQTNGESDGSTFSTDPFKINALNKKFTFSFIELTTDGFLKCDY